MGSEAGQSPGGGAEAGERGPGPKRPRDGVDRDREGGAGARSRHARECDVAVDAPARLDRSERALEPDQQAAGTLVVVESPLPRGSKEVRRLYVRGAEDAVGAEPVPRAQDARPSLTPSVRRDGEGGWGLGGWDG